MVDPDILAMEDALDHGDHVETARLARGLVASPNESLRGTGEAMLARLRPDPVILGVFAVTGLLAVALAVAYLGRHG